MTCASIKLQNKTIFNKRISVSTKTRLGNIVSFEDDGGSVGSAHADFHEGSEDGHHHSYRHLQVLAVVAEGQGVVACNSHNHQDCDHD